jgi:hypothetical protein
MKKYGGILLFACLSMGCVSMGKGKNITHYAPVAVVSVVSNYDINWFEEEPTARNMVGDFVRSALNFRDDNTRVIISKADELINDADTLLRTTLAGAGFGEIAEKEQVIQARAYSAAGINPHQQGENTITAAGYRPVYYRDKAFPPNLAGETGIKSCMFVVFDFTKKMISGIGKNGTFRAELAMGVTLIDTAGKTIYTKTFNAHSFDRIAVSGGGYYHEELLELFQEAIAEACTQLIMDLKPAAR